MSSTRPCPYCLGWSRLSWHRLLFCVLCFARSPAMAKSSCVEGRTLGQTNLGLHPFGLAAWGAGEARGQGWLLAPSLQLQLMTLLAEGRPGAVTYWCAVPWLWTGGRGQKASTALPASCGQMCPTPQLAAQQWAGWHGHRQRWARSLCLCCSPLTGIDVPQLGRPGSAHRLQLVFSAVNPMQYSGPASPKALVSPDSCRPWWKVSLLSSSSRPE